MTKKETKERINDLKIAIDDLGTMALSVAKKLEPFGDDQFNHTIKIIIGITAALYGSVKKRELRLINGRFKRSVKHGEKSTSKTTKAR